MHDYNVETKIIPPCSPCAAQHIRECTYTVGCDACCRRCLRPGTESAVAANDDDADADTEVATTADVCYTEREYTKCNARGRIAIRVRYDEDNCLVS